MKKNKILTLSLIILTTGVIIAGGILWFNLAYSVPPGQQQPYVSCNPSSLSINEGGIVTFTATTGNYDTADCTLSYTWSGSRASALGCLTGLTCTTPPLFSSVIVRSNYSASHPTTYDLGVRAYCGGQSAFNFCTVTVNHPFNHPFRSRLDVSVSVGGQGVATHLACGANNVCASVSGAGADSCSPEGARCGHFECRGDNVCASVSGSGVDRCSKGDDCFLKSISVSLNPSTILVNGISQATAIAHYSNNSTNDVTTDSETTWGSGNKSVATISSSGVVTGKNPGTATITATYSDIKGSATLSVVSCPSGETRPHNECLGSSCSSVDTCGVRACSNDIQCQR